MISWTFCAVNGFNIDHQWLLHILTIFLVHVCQNKRLKIVHNVTVNSFFYIMHRSSSFHNNQNCHHDLKEEFYNTSYQVCEERIILKVWENSID